MMVNGNAWTPEAVTGPADMSLGPAPAVPATAPSAAHTELPTNPPTSHSRRLGELRANRIRQAIAICGPPSLELTDSRAVAVVRTLFSEMEYIPRYTPRVANNVREGAQRLAKAQFGLAASALSASPIATLN